MSDNDEFEVKKTEAIDMSEVLAQYEAQRARPQGPQGPGQMQGGQPRPQGTGYPQGQGQPGPGFQQGPSHPQGQGYHQGPQGPGYQQAGHSASTQQMPNSRQAGTGPGPMQGLPPGQMRFNLQLSGAELFVQLLIGYLLTAVTLGIYGPWFMCKLANFLASKLSYGPTRAGALRFQFNGAGGQLFGKMFVGYLLTLITLGIYAPWFMVSMLKWGAENTVGIAEDGSQYQVQFNGTGGQFFVKMLVGYLLTILTVGIYGAWFVCALHKFFASNTTLHQNGQQVGNLDFVGTGGKLFVTFFVGYLLSIVTLGIYAFWLAVKMMKFFSENTVATVKGRTYVGGFHGTGGEYFKVLFVGYLLTLITGGIYGAWFMTNMLKFKYNNRSFQPGAPQQG